MSRVARVVRLVAVVTGAAAAVGLSSAQHTSFEPVVYLQGSYTDNVGVVESSGSATEAASNSDSYATLGARLPITRTMRFGSIGFSYSGEYARYDRNTVYDNLAHSAEFVVSPRLRSGASLSANLSYTLSQEQGTPSRIEDEEQFLTVRTDRTYYEGEITYSKEGRRSLWDGTFRASRSEYEPIGGTVPDPQPPDPQTAALVPENRTYWYGSFEFRHKFSRRFSLGPRYDVALAELSRSPDELTHVLAVAFGWQVSQYFSVDATIGASRRTSDSAGTEGETPQETALAWLLTLRIDPPLAAIQNGKIKLGLDVGVSPSGGGALAGTSTNSYARLYLRSGTTRSRWSWELGTRYTRRDSTLDTVPLVETGGLEGSVQYAIGSLFSLQLGAGWSKQLNAETDATTASFRNATLGVVVYPKGRATSGRS